MSTVAGFPRTTTAAAALMIGKIVSTTKASDAANFLPGGEAYELTLDASADFADMTDEDKNLVRGEVAEFLNVMKEHGGMPSISERIDMLTAAIKSFDAVSIGVRREVVEETKSSRITVVALGYFLDMIIKAALKTSGKVEGFQKMAKLLGSLGGTLKDGVDTAHSADVLDELDKFPAPKAEDAPAADKPKTPAEEKWSDAENIT